MGLGLFWSRLTGTRAWTSNARSAKTLAKRGQHTDQQAAENSGSSRREAALGNSGDERARNKEPLAIPPHVEARPLPY